MITRREWLGRTRLGAGIAGLFGVFGSAPAASASRLNTQLTGAAERLFATIDTYPLDDTHCHPVTTRDATTTPDSFLQRISLTAMGAPGYFPAGVLQKWQVGDADVKRDLDRQFGITRTLAPITRHIGESVFVKYMVKEMAGFLGCRGTLNEVIEAHNTRGKKYPGYIRSLFQDVKLENVMLDTGFREGLDTEAIQDFARAIAPTKCRGIARVETLQGDLLRQGISLAELERTFVTRVREALDGTANFGVKSSGMKSYLLPRIGLIKPVYDAKLAAAS
jgi:hypothetical protein